MMTYKTFQQLVLLLVCSSLILLSGSHLFKMNEIHSFKDAILTMLFFICIFPFTFMLIMMLKKMYKSLFKRY